jgi:hypothetical protein
MADFQAATKESATATGKLGTAYKAFFYFVRAYQDTVYRMILNVHGQNWRATQTTMNRAHKDRNLVGVLLRARLPEYLPWFAEWREKRNQIKDGVTTGWAGPDTDLGLVFNDIIVTPTTYASRTDISTAIRLSEAATAMSMSAGVTTLLDELIKGRRR